MIKIKKLFIKCNNFYIFRNLNFFFLKNNIYVLTGNNGTGKSSFLKSFVNDENYFLTGEIYFQKYNIKLYELDFVSRIGIFISYQNSIEIKNIKNIFFLKTCFEIFNFNKKFFFKKLKCYIKLLFYKKDLLNRSYNVGFSGGEKKKNEFLFLLIINPILILLDEIDSGLDQTSVLIIFNYLNLIKKNKYIILISHNKNINNFLLIDFYLKIKKNKINILKCI
ncbi:putative ABC transporter ATP-binding component [Candidatus Carsonella ruddii PV]|uniref:Putative ABC transporter ATP-binding component n=1 Tax=Carsonella ruddii (strain PV) TaxID=387662 RepID=Q05FV7_CARRP|nr:ATP-binding cassette domain-containing protein [Candidatus Carsonella ruddii]BAF35064.1 putative ABC transporter ATP-binding component [Candidatus Carsonella ruddii PV]